MEPDKELEWSDRILDPDEDPERPEPVYRDGSAQNECWSGDGYTREADWEDSPEDGRAEQPD